MPSVNRLELMMIFKVMCMKFPLFARSFVLALACSALLLLGHAAPAIAQEASTEAQIPAKTPDSDAVKAEAEKADVTDNKAKETTPAKVAGEKAANEAEQGKLLEPKQDNEQAKDARPQEEQPAAAYEAHEQPVIGMAKDWQLGMMPAASPVQERLISFHHGLLILITVISLVVLVLLIYVCVKFSAKNNPVPSKNAHNTLIEIIWTVIPVLLVIAILIPSFKHLYYMDHSEIEGKADVTIKIIGYQWYWNYEYPDAGFAFDSYIVKEEDLKPGQPRLLTVDNEIVVPVGKKVLLQITGGDVIHSWALPSFGVKMDAVPGHLNETWFQADHLGIYYGQCSELCGVNHGFMPITVRVVTQEEYEAWLEAAKAKFS